MKNQIARVLKVALGALPMLLLSPVAFAYVGPGAGLSALGSVLAFIGTVLLLFVGFLWYPVKRLFSKGRTVAQNDDGAFAASNDSGNFASQPDRDTHGS